MEDPYSMAGSKELGKDTMKEFNLPRSANDFIVNISAGTYLVLDTLEEKRVLAYLSQLHKLVAKTFDTSRFASEGKAHQYIARTIDQGTHPLVSLPSAIILNFFICLYSWL